jgi:CHAD domain-containing protein
VAYRLKASKPFDQQFRAVGKDQLAKAIHDLEEQPEGPHEAIHDARKRFKRVRALYRLVRFSDPDFRERENARIRDIAQSLSVVRDATALVETVDYLLGFANAPEEKAALEGACEVLRERRDDIAAHEHDLPQKIKAAIDACHEAMGALEDFHHRDTPARTAKQLGKAWKKQLQKALAALEACETDAHAETYHDLRKSGQAYWMHLSLLRDVWPSAMMAKQAQAKALVDLLGHEHDLSVLTQLVNDQPDLFGTSENLALLLGAIIARQQSLRGEAVELAHQVFADRPQVEAGLIADLWERRARH